MALPLRKGIQNHGPALHIWAQQGLQCEAEPPSSIVFWIPCDFGSAALLPLSPAPSLEADRAKTNQLNQFRVAGGCCLAFAPFVKEAPC